MLVYIDGLKAAQATMHGRTTGMFTGLPAGNRESDWLTEVIS
jgi:uncharacterized protein YgfB (UPF0149 family)